MTFPRPTKLVLCELADASAYGVESFSPFCLKVHRALQAAGLSYERRHGRMPGFAEGDPASDRCPSSSSTTSPSPTRPTSCGGSRRSRDRSAASLDPRTRAEAWLWEELADTSLNGFLVAARWADDRNWPAVRQAYFGRAPWLVRALVAPRSRGGS